MESSAVQYEKSWNWERLLQTREQSNNAGIV